MVNGAGDNHPLRGGKATVYEGGLRVPAFIYAPAFLPQQKIDHRITVHDMLPTLAAAAEVADFDASDLDGANQWEFLKQAAPPMEQPFVSVGKWGQACFKDDWKLILDKEGKVELYQIIEDSTEQNNLADQYPEIVEALRQELLAVPRGESIDDPLWKVFLDTDRFGGEIDREPYAGKEGTVSGPLHRSFYLAGGIAFLILALLFWAIRKLYLILTRKP